MTRRMALFAPLALLLVAASPGAAQQRAFAGLGGGVVMPQVDGVDDGWGLVLFGRYARARSAVGGQVDFQYWNIPGALSSDDVDVFASTFNLVLTFPQRTDAKLKFYGMGGIGFYAINGIIDRYPFGLNGGGGLELVLGTGKNSLFADARYHNLFQDPDDTQWLSIMGGLKFRVR